MFLDFHPTIEKTDRSFGINAWFGEILQQPFPWGPGIFPGFGHFYPTAFNWNWYDENKNGHIRQTIGEKAQMCIGFG